MSSEIINLIEGAKTAGVPWSIRLAGVGELVVYGDDVICYDASREAIDVTVTKPCLPWRGDFEQGEASTIPKDAPSTNVSAFLAAMRRGVPLDHDGHPRVMVPFSGITGALDETALWEVDIVASSELELFERGWKPTRKISDMTFGVSRVRDAWSNSQPGRSWPVKGDQVFAYCDVTPFATALSRYKGFSPQLGHLLAAWRHDRRRRGELRSGDAALELIVASARFDEFHQNLAPVQNVSAKIDVFRAYCDAHGIDRAVMIVHQENYQDGPRALPTVLFEKSNAGCLRVSEPTVVGVHTRDLDALLDALDTLMLPSKDIRRRAAFGLLVALILLASASAMWGVGGEEPASKKEAPLSPNLEEDVRGARDGETTLPALGVDPGRIERDSKGKKAIDAEIDKIMREDQPDVE